MILKCRVAFAALLAGAAERHALVEHDPIADDRCLADDHAHAMIDEEATPDLRAGMNLDPGHEATELRDQARDKGYAPRPQCVGYAMQGDCVEARVEQDFGQVTRGRVVPQNRAHIIAQNLELGW